MALIIFNMVYPLIPARTRFRKRVSREKLEHLLKELLSIATREGYLKERYLEYVNIDTAVQEKAITFPTDAKLYYKMREAFVSYAKEHSIYLRQNYSPQCLIKQSRYAHAKQYKHDGRQTKQFKTYLGRVYRDIQRKSKEPY